MRLAIRCVCQGVSLREMGEGAAQAMVLQELVGHEPFALLGAGAGALVAYECAKHLRKAHGLQPKLLVVLGAPGPQAFVDDFDFDEPADGDGPPPPDGATAGPAQHVEKEAPPTPLSEEDDETLVELVVTLERGFMPPEAAECPALLGVGLSVFRADAKVRGGGCRNALAPGNEPRCFPAAAAAPSLPSCVGGLLYRGLRCAGAGGLQVRLGLALQPAAGAGAEPLRWPGSTGRRDDVGEGDDQAPRGGRARKRGSVERGEA